MTGKATGSTSVVEYYTPGRAIAAAFRLSQSILREYLKGSGVQPGHADFLYVVSKMEGITQRELSEVMMVSRPAVAQTAKALEAAGLIERVTSATDRRAVNLFLTERGRSLAPALEEAFARLTSVQETALTQRGNREFKECLVRTVDALAAEHERLADATEG